MTLTPRRLDTLWARAQASAREDYVDTWRYGNYNVTDIAAEAEASLRIPDLTGEELEWWRIHERINRRGVHIDRAGVENCIAIVEQAFAKYNTELQTLTGIDAASKVAQLQDWLHGRGVHLDSLDEEHVTAALKYPVLAPDVRRVLEIRALVGSASIKKLYAIRHRLSDDDRLRDLYIYHGARTGRSTGEGPQPTNVPRAGPDLIHCQCGQHYGAHRNDCPFCLLPRGELRPVEWTPEMAEQALEQAKHRSLEWFEHVYGEALSTIAGCLRALFDSAPGHDLLSTDYNSIEAVGLAMLAGERWRIKVFQTHGKIYEASASTMYGVPLEEILNPPGGGKHPLRQKGKIGELAFGYQGWLGAAKAFEMPGADDEIKADILRWRAASPAVEWSWGGQQIRKAKSILVNAAAPEYDGASDPGLVWILNSPREQGWDTYYFGVEGMAVLAVLEPGQWHEVCRMDGSEMGVGFYYDAETARLYCRLLSGRLLTYHNIVLSQSDRGGYAISYEGWNTNPKNGPIGWIRMDTWGGRLVENINQAQCRDILRAACLLLEQYDYPVVLHVYDEIVSEVPEGVGSIEEFEHIVTALVIAALSWATDWPIRAPGGYRKKRYRKA